MVLKQPNLHNNKLISNYLKGLLFVRFLQVNSIKFDLSYRVADKDWGADFRKLSAGAALVGLTLWLDLMQANLPPFPPFFDISNDYHI